MKKPYSLDERTFLFAKDVRLFCKQIDYSITNVDDIKQVVRSSGSVGANYIEANDNLSDKDFLYRIKICRKEAKESVFWLRLIKETVDIDESLIQPLINEADELKRIFNAIINKKEK